MIINVLDEFDDSVHEFDISDELYDMAFNYNRLGYASAISWVMFIIVILIVGVIVKTSKKWVYYLGQD